MAIGTAEDATRSDGPKPRVALPCGRRAGPHLPIAMGLLKVAGRATEIGASTVQVFSDNPTAWQRRAAPLPDHDEFRRRMRAADIGPLAIHASYLINLAGPIEDLFVKSVGLLRHELEHAHELAAAFVNVHTGSHRGAGPEAGIDRLIDGIALATDGLDVGVDHSLAHTPGGEPKRPLLVLENSSGGGAAVGVTIEELAAILDAAAARGQAQRFGFCLDSAHLWGAGYDIGDPEGVDSLLDRFRALIGLDRLRMIHLNDSHSARGSRHDRHAHLGEGQIPRAGLARLICHPDLAHVAYFFETPDMERGFDAVNLARMEDLAAGRELTEAPSPAEAPA